MTASRVSPRPLVALMLLAGCAAAPATNPEPLSPANVNLVFVVSQDLAFHAPGDLNLATSNLTSQGLQRALRMSTYLRQDVLGGNDAARIYALAPMTHLQTANHYPDMVALETIQPFALLNHTTLSSDLTGGSPYTGQNSPINASYGPDSVPAGVTAPARSCPTCRGLDFADQGGANEALVDAIVAAGVPGSYVFSAPWETVRAILEGVQLAGGSYLPLPRSYAGPNTIYAISIAPSGALDFLTFDSGVSPPASYPVLPPPALASASCRPHTPPTITVTGGIDGAVVPANANVNQTLYIVRHAEAHPQRYWSDNNYVGAGQWRALSLASTLEGKASPDQVWSVDPATFSQGTVSASGDQYWSSVAPALTVGPYAIAKGLPFHLLASVDLDASSAARLVSDRLFTGGELSQHKVLLGWVFNQSAPVINALLASYFPGGGAPSAPAWPPDDYDSLWIVTVDASGNLSLDFTQCQGIDSAQLPAAPPPF